MCHILNIYLHFHTYDTGPTTKLNVSHFESDIIYYSDKFHAGTRQWVLDEISEWRNKSQKNKNQCNMFMVAGNPGMGKSVLAAKLCSVHKKENTLAGCFFFQHNLGRRSNPKVLIQSLCHQFQSTIDGYFTLIEQEISEINPEVLNAFELFSYLVKEPLSRLEAPSGESMVIIIDALDECDFESRPELLKLLIREFIRLPKWIQIIFTTRPDKKILKILKKIKCVINLLPEDPRNLKDIQLFLGDFLKNKMRDEEFDAGIELLLQKSEGMFLYFHYAIDNLEDMESISLDELHSLLPDGIDDYYEHNFHRLYQSLGHGQYQIFLQGIMITRSDFPQELVAPLLGVSGQEADKILSKISTLLPIRDGFISIFHKSVKDWLFDSDISGKYAVDAGAGHKYLASLCQSQLKNLKEKFGLSSLDDFLNSPVNQFIVQNIIHHVCHGVQAWSFPQVLNIIEDLQFMFFRLLFSHGRTDGLLDDLIEVLEFSSKSQKICQRARDCYHFIKRYAHLLNNDPHLIFQCALNEPSMFSERLGIRQFLADPLRAFPGLKILLQVENKNEQFSSSLITFSCDDSITSCVLSPDFKVLVGSDISGIVYFWDVSSGELINKADLSGEVRFPNSINCCNISPDGSMVVYGSIMHALNFDAEKVPLIKTDVDHGTNMSIFSPSGEHILAFSYHPDGYFKLFEELEISLDMNFFLEIWDIFDSKYHTLQKVKRKESRPMCGCFSADGKKVFCGYRNGCVIQWDTTSRAASAYLLSTDLVLREGKALCFHGCQH